MQKLIKILEEFRLEQRLTQEQIASKLGVSFSTVSRWFNNKTNPNKIQAYHIKKLLEKEDKV